jgi:hypothetical protein
MMDGKALRSYGFVRREVVDSLADSHSARPLFMQAPRRPDMGTGVAA